MANTHAKILKVYVPDVQHQVILPNNALHTRSPTCPTWQLECKVHKIVTQWKLTCSEARDIAKAKMNQPYKEALMSNISQTEAGMSTSTPKSPPAAPLPTPQQMMTSLRHVITLHPELRQEFCQFIQQLTDSHSLHSTPQRLPSIVQEMRQQHNTAPTNQFQTLPQSPQSTQHFHLILHLLNLQPTWTLTLHHQQHPQLTLIHLQHTTCHIMQIKWRPHTTKEVLTASVLLLVHVRLLLLSMVLKTMRQPCPQEYLRLN